MKKSKSLWIAYPKLSKWAARNNRITRCCCGLRASQLALADMGRLISSALILFSIGLKAETLGNWEYFIPEDSPFSLEPIDNGLYLQFSGNYTFSAQIAVQEKSNVIAILDNETAELLPYRKLLDIQKARYIQLLDSAEFLKSIDIESQENIGGTDFYIIGSAIVSINGLQSGADCGTANFFAFKNSVENFVSGENTKVYHEHGC